MILIICLMKAKVLFVRVFKVWFIIDYEFFESGMFRFKR